MSFILTLIPFLPFLIFIFPTSVFAQGLTQEQTCNNACAAAYACNSQCQPGMGADPYERCLCQGGCLCNAEICLQCCGAAGLDPKVASCNTAYQLAGGNIISFCGIGLLLPGQNCFVYGENSAGKATSTYAPNSPFPTSVQTFISGLPVLVGITIPALSPTVGKTSATPGTSQTIANTGTTTSPSPTVSSATSVTSQPTAVVNTGTTTSPSPTVSSAASQTRAAGTSQTNANISATTSPSPTTSSATSVTSPSTVAVHTGAAGKIWPMAAKGSLLSLPLFIGLCL